MSIDATSWAWSCHGLRPAQKLVLLSLADRAGENNTCWPSLNRLVSDTGLDIRTIRVCLKDLCDAGLIARTEESGRGYTYTLIGVENRESTPPKNATGDKNAPGTLLYPDPSQKCTPTPPKNVPGPLPKVHPESLREPIKNHKENRKSARAREKPPDKILFGKFGNVKLTPQEHETLIATHGEDRTREAIAFLDLHLGAKKGADPYKSHYMAMLKWVFDAVDERQAKQARASPNGGPQPSLTEKNMQSAANVLTRRAQRDKEIFENGFPR